MFGKTGFGKSVYGSAFKDLPFVPLQSATFCVQCELISSSRRPYCLACGSTALLGLSRVLGGSLGRQRTAHLITDSELDSLVRDLLHTVPDPIMNEADPYADHAYADHSRTPSLALRSQLRVANAAHPASGFRAVAVPEEIEIRPAELDLEPAISAITERAQHLTGATGAAIALRAGDEIVCRARTGRTSPDLGVRLQTDAAFPRKPCVRARSCSVTTPSVIPAWIWLAAAVSVSVPSWSRPCATTGARWAFSRYSHPLREPSTSATWPPCNSCPA